VNKSTFVIATFVMFASGCALLETPPSESQSSAVAPPVEPQTPPVQVTLEGPRAETFMPRSFTVDELRRIQLRLRDAGFDPGPADGVAGTRTKAALGRYQAGCDKAKTLLDDFDGSGAPIKATPSRQENQVIQVQLRNAGFDPGPADGIFGARTRRTLAQLKTNCPVLTEAATALNDANSPREPQAGIASTAAAAPVKGRAVAVSSVETSRAADVPQTREEIRVLQLRLRDAGFNPGPFDGVMGPRTVAALQQYEASDRGKKTKASLRTTQVNGQY
jgi:peptidoglycan hydrolase-like protein with peptidoglycan-binding domain